MKKTFEILKVSILSIALKFIYGTNRKNVVGKNNYKRINQKKRINYFFCLAWTFTFNCA